MWNNRSFNIYNELFAQIIKKRACYETTLFDSSHVVKMEGYYTMLLYKSIYFL